MDFSRFFPFEQCQLARTRYEFLDFPYRRGPKKPLQAAASPLRAGVLISRLVGFINFLYCGTKKSPKSFSAGRKIFCREEN
jgi:hypothetical protein